MYCDLTQRFNLGFKSILVKFYEITGFIWKLK